MNDVYSLCILASKHLNQTLTIVRESDDYILYKVKGDTTIPLVRTSSRKSLCEHLQRKIRSAKKKRLNIQIPSGLHEQLKQTCVQDKISISEVVQELILNHLNKA